MGRKSEQVKFKMLAIPWFRLNFKLFYNREKEPRSRAVAVPPPAPLSSFWLYYGSKKLGSGNFLLQRTAERFSANIIWLLVYLFAKSFCLRGVVNAAASRRPLHGYAKLSQKLFKKLPSYAQTK